MSFLSSLLPSIFEVGGKLLGAPPGVGKAVGTVVGSAFGGDSGSGGASTPGSAVQAADPFASQRPQYQQQLQQLMTGNFSPTDPSYKWRFDQGLEGVNRGAAASGMLNSGNRLAALSDYGQNTASTEYSNQYNRLAQLSGAQIGSPSTAAGLIQGNAASASALGQQVGSQLGSGLQSWWNSTVSPGTRPVAGPSIGTVDASGGGMTSGTMDNIIQSAGGW